MQLLTEDRLNDQVVDLFIMSIKNTIRFSFYPVCLPDQQVRIPVNIVIIVIWHPDTKYFYTRTLNEWLTGQYKIVSQGCLTWVLLVWWNCSFICIVRFITYSFVLRNHIWKLKRLTVDRPLLMNAHACYDASCSAWWLDLLSKQGCGQLKPGSGVFTQICFNTRFTLTMIEN